MNFDKKKMQKGRGIMNRIIIIIKIIIGGAYNAQLISTTDISMRGNKDLKVQKTLLQNTLLQKEYIRNKQLNLQKRMA